MPERPATPRYGHAPIAMRRVAGFDEIERAGDFYWNLRIKGVRRLVFTEPALEGHEVVSIPVARGDGGRGAHWGWDGNEERPTLKPSVHTFGVWHGWIRDGKLVEA